MANVIYKQFVLPLLDYVDFIIESAPKRAVDQLDKIQRRAVKIMDRGIHHMYNTVGKTVQPKTSKRTKESASNRKAKG